MKKNLTLVMASILLVGLAGFAIAQGSGIHDAGTGLEKPELMEAGQGTGQGFVDGAKLMAGNYSGEGGEQIQIQEQSNERVRLEFGGVGADCDCDLTGEYDPVQNRTKLKVALSNGRNAEVKIMPNVASETGLSKLKLKTCDEEKGCSIELKEVGEGEGAKLAYEIKTERQSRIFGLFKAKMNVQAQVNAETGEVIQTKKPWWAFLASEPAE